MSEPLNIAPPTNGSFALVPPRHRTGAIARLPKEVRWRLNQMLDDGFSYSQIQEDLGQHGKTLNEDIIGRWKRSGYQDYLREQRLIDQCASRRAGAYALLAKAGQLNGLQATQQVATAQICETMVDIGADILREALIANPLNYFRMLNAFSRLTNGGIKCERLLAEQAQRTAQSKTRSSRAKKGISPASVREMEQKLNLM